MLLFVFFALISDHASSLKSLIKHSKENVP